MPDSEKHIFVTKKGEEFSFDTEDEMMEFATKATIKSMVEDGFGSMILKEGEEVFQINERGLQFIRDHDGDSIH